MKIDRMIGILTILLRRRKMTVGLLAEIYEVSRRTIQRDIEALNQAGIPIVTESGPTGGVSLMPDYQLDQTLLTSKEMQAILVGLRSLDSVSGSHWYGQLMEKLKTGSAAVLPGDTTMLVDLASWYKGSLAPKLEGIHKAIDRKQAIAFTYYSKKGESKRQIDPYYLLFQWSSWYVWGLDRESWECKMFKLNRIEDLSIIGEAFLCEETVVPQTTEMTNFPDKYELVASFNKKCKWKLIDAYGRDSFKEMENGRLLFIRGFADWEYMKQWILGFGAEVEVMVPIELRRELADIGKAMAKLYNNE